MAEDLQRWLTDLQNGESQAEQELWEAYFAKLRQVAQQRLAGFPRRVVDEEDVALSALNSFVNGARAGRFSQLQDDLDLWKLLVVITARKATAQRRRHLAARRSGGKVRGESAFGDVNQGPGAGINAFGDAAPTPEFIAEMSERLEELFAKLGDPILCTIARLKMESYSNEEIADRLQRNVRTVERKLSLIRACWIEDAELHE